MYSKKQNDDYKRFCGEICLLFDKSWDKIQNVADAAWNYLDHIPDNAWQPMAAIASESWEGWPRNFTKSVRELYMRWQAEAKVQRSVRDCEYCNGNGFFSGVKHIEVKTGKFQGYSHTWRCGACRNWFGLLGTNIPEAYPLEISTRGFTVQLYPRPLSLENPDDLVHRDIDSALFGVGKRVSPKFPRPDVAPLVESYVDRWSEQS